MKTYIVQLEDHDDVISARDKISWSKARRVLLVWPRKGRVLDRRLDLILLQRHCQQSGSQLALVTKQSEVKGYARELGIPVFRNAEAGQYASWRRPRARRRSIWQIVRSKRPAVDQNQLRAQAAQVQGYHPWLAENRWLRLVVFTLGVLSFLGLALFFAPAAQVELKLKQRPQNLTIAVWASPTLDAPVLSGGLPAQAIIAVVEGRDQASSTGQAKIPAVQAAGKIVLTNLTDQPVDIPAGSVALTGGEPVIRFLTTQAVRVPGGPEKTVEVYVRAQLPGSGGNVSTGKIQAMEGPLGLRLTVTNPQPTSGGQDRTSPAPSSQDYLALQEKLLAQLQANALEELRGQITPGQHLLESTVRKNKVIEETREPAEGQPGDNLQLNLRVEFEAYVVNENDLQAVGLAALDANQEKGFHAVPGSQQISFASQTSFDAEGTARWNIQVSRILEADWSQDRALIAVRGQGIEEAKHILQSSLPLDGTPRIRMYPNWWTRLPYLPFRITWVMQ